MVSAWKMVQNRIGIMHTCRSHEEIINFIARGTRPATLAEFSPSQETKDRVADLIYREKTNELSEEERGELNHYLEISPIDPKSVTREPGLLPVEK